MSTKENTFKKLYDEQEKATNPNNECEATRDKEVISMSQLLDFTNEITVTGIHYFVSKEKKEEMLKVGIAELPMNFIFAPAGLLQFFKLCMQSMGGEAEVNEKLQKETCTFVIEKVKTKTNKDYYKFTMKG